MAREVGSAGWLLVAWAITGVLTITAALSYGELAAMMPLAGGQYVLTAAHCFEPGDGAENRPADRARRLTIQTGRRRQLGELLVGLQLLFDLAKDALLIVGQWHVRSLAGSR